MCVILKRFKFIINSPTGLKLGTAGYLGALIRLLPFLAHFSKKWAIACALSPSVCSISSRKKGFFGSLKPFKLFPELPVTIFGKRLMTEEVWGS